MKHTKLLISFLVRTVLAVKKFMSADEVMQFLFQHFYLPLINKATIFFKICFFKGEGEIGMGEATWAYAWCFIKCRIKCVAAISGIERVWEQHITEFPRISTFCLNHNIALSNLSAPTIFYLNLHPSLPPTNSISSVLSMTFIAIHTLLL